MRQTIVLSASIFLLLASGATGCSGAPETPAYTPGLGEIMTLTQMRHSKLWFAGQAANWSLAEYELDELNEGMQDVATFHPTHKDSPLPIPELIQKIMTEPIQQAESAVKTRDESAFVKAFDGVTEACNSCHKATNFGFNVVTRPAANPFSNQAFQAPQ